MNLAMLLIKGAVILTIVLILFFIFKVISEFRRGLFARYFKGFVAGMILILIAWVIDLSFFLSHVNDYTCIPRMFDLLGFVTILLSIVFLIGRFLNPYDGVDV